MAGIRTCDRESQVQRPNHYTTEPPMIAALLMCKIFLIMWQQQRCPIQFWHRKGGKWREMTLLWTQKQKNLMHMHVLTVSKLFHLLPILLLIKIMIIISRAACYFQEHLHRPQHNRHWSAMVFKIKVTNSDVQQLTMSLLKTKNYQTFYCLLSECHLVRMKQLNQ